MRIHKAGHEIRSVDEWFTWAPPKRGPFHWKDGHSAKELARSWFRSDTAQPPVELVSLLTSTLPFEIVFEEATPECTVKLDDFKGETRNCDLVIVGRAGAQRIVISVEAKADEPFGSATVGHYYDEKVGSSSKVPERIVQLSQAIFGRHPDEVIRGLRYQLLHSAAASLIEAANYGADLAVFLVHEFSSVGLSDTELKRNAKDWMAFVNAFPVLAEATVSTNQILGPVSIPGGGRVPRSIPLYLGNVVSTIAP